MAGYSGHGGAPDGADRFRRLPALRCRACPANPQRPGLWRYSASPDRSSDSDERDHHKRRRGLVGPTSYKLSHPRQTHSRVCCSTHVNEPLSVHRPPGATPRWLPSVRGPLAQLAEQRTFNPWVLGSIPRRPTILPGRCSLRSLPGKITGHFGDIFGVRDSQTYPARRRSAGRSACAPNSGPGSC